MTVTHTQPHTVDDRLHQLGLKTEWLNETIRRGYLSFISCTPNDPPLYPGFSAWAMMVRSLREYLLPEGWERCDENNYSRVINSTRALAIVVATGDAATGQPDAQPMTKSSKGPSTAEAVASNQLTLDLIFPAFELPQSARQSSQDKQLVTWILLVHRAQGEVRFELSLPMSMGLDGRVDRWLERIIIGAIPTDPYKVEVTPPKPPQQPDIDVAVKRRT